MNNFEFCNPVKVVFGKGTIARLSSLIPERSNVLMLYGEGSIKKNNVYTQVTETLKNYRLMEFSGIEANPHYETCMKTRLHEYGIEEKDLDALTEPIDQLGWKLSEKGHIDTKAAREILSLRL
ncbi:MAG: iron-containing alcohol dehydrogenase [Tannerellaceae bacterium]|jgi:alcohol dehydrogenase YqhD (iron-dependent ADH family)|nr:iron-containing alcohol dehydrogenase [Tannerellaceae bacterium]